MYGLLLESIAGVLRQKYGNDTWEIIRRRAQVEFTSFSIHEKYPEWMIPAIANAAFEVTGENTQTLFDNFGKAFVSFVGKYGYDRVLTVLGRNMRDFLNGLDNLHEYLRFSYKEMNPPSFFCENESSQGLTLHYRSKRRGFVPYVVGQIKEVGRLYYKTDVNIQVLSELNEENETSHVVMRLIFDNSAFTRNLHHLNGGVVNVIPLRPEFLFELFPFHIAFSRTFSIRHIGMSLNAVVPNALGKKLNQVFTLERPLVPFTWEAIMGHTNNAFQLKTHEPVIASRSSVPTKLNAHSAVNGGDDDQNDLPSPETDNEEEQNENEEGKSNDPRKRHIKADYYFDSDEGGAKFAVGPPEKAEEDEGEDPATETVEKWTPFLMLKGQMIYMAEWDAIMFLGVPLMDSLDDMMNAGLYINDLSMHDSSRDLVLAGTQQSAELKLALDQEQAKSKLLMDSVQRLDAEKRRTDSLLYQMIPKSVADRLRGGEPAVNTCEVFQNVTILFSDVVGFTTICSQISPMEVVGMLNAMYTKFDNISENHGAYKVETIGDAYMVVSGAPTVREDHAACICDMALDMLACMAFLIDPSTKGNMRIRVGIHTGTTVAGVVGIKMPRYCLFGDTVNTASRMETSGEAMKIHISETTKCELNLAIYAVEPRGTILLKGKGEMKTYWLLGKRGHDGSIFQPMLDVVHLEKETDRETADRNATPALADLLDSDRPVYSPVSFEDITPVTPRRNSSARQNRSIDFNSVVTGSSSSRTDSAAFLPHHGLNGEDIGMGMCPFAQMAMTEQINHEQSKTSPPDLGPLISHRGSRVHATPEPTPKSTNILNNGLDGHSTKNCAGEEVDSVPSSKLHLQRDINVNEGKTAKNKMQKNNLAFVSTRQEPVRSKSHTCHII